MHILPSALLMSSLLIRFCRRMLPMPLGLWKKSSQMPSKPRTTRWLKSVAAKCTFMPSLIWLKRRGGGVNDGGGGPGLGRGCHQIWEELLARSLPRSLVRRSSRFVQLWTFWQSTIVPFPLSRSFPQLQNIRSLTRQLLVTGYRVAACLL